MRKNNGINILDLDMYSNRISFFSNNRERIGSVFGLILTIIYILAFFVIFGIFSYEVIERSDLRVNDSNIFSNKTPSIDINSNDMNFAFGLEDPLTSNKYIDPSIYYPEIIFFERIKDEDGEFKTVKKKELKYNRCKNDSFGENYRDVFGDIEITNSYCLEEFNLTLAGGYKYNRMSYIRIRIMPCINNTKDIVCKPKEVIDTYLNRGYLSMFLKDIGLNPSNYSVPVIPTLQNLYTTIDKKIFREYIINYGITEIHTDTGLFYENIDKKQYLRYVSEQETFYFRTDEEDTQGKQLSMIQIRLDDNIVIQKRSYKKLPEIFSLIGGYMQLLSTIFSLISILTNFNLEINIINNLFNFNMKQNKITIRINNIKDFNENKNKTYKSSYTSKKTLSLKRINKQISENNININISNTNNNNVSISKNILLNNDYNNKSYLPIVNNIQNMTENAGNSQIIINNHMDSNKKSLFIHHRNSKSNNLSLSMRTKTLKPEKIPYFRPTNRFNDSYKISYKDINFNIEDNNNIHLNLFNYYCCGNVCRKRRHIELFDIGVSLYRKRMDIINAFTILLLTEKILLKIEKQKINTFTNENLEQSRNDSNYK